MSQVICEKPWLELQDGKNGYAKGDNSQWPLATMTPNEVHKFLMCVCDLRIHGTLQNETDTPDPITFDLVASDATGFVAPTEISHITKSGMSGGVAFDKDGDMVESDSPDFRGGVSLKIGHSLSLPEGGIVLINGSNSYIPFSVRVSGSITGRVETGPFSGTLGVDYFAATATCTFFGFTVPLFYSAPFNDLTGSLTIEAPATGGYLTFGGTRDPDDGSASVTHF